MTEKLSKASKQLGIAYISVWATMVISAVGLFLFWHKGNDFGRVLYWIAFVVGFGTAGFGVVAARGFNNAMREAGHSASVLLWWSFIVLIICNLLSLTSLYGASPILPMKEGAMTFISLGAMVIFWLFPLFTSICFSRYDRINNSFRKAFIVSIIFAVITLFMSPLVITMINAGNAGDDKGGVNFFNVLYALVYGILLTLFIMPLFTMKPTQHKEG